MQKTIAVLIAALVGVAIWWAQIHNPAEESSQAVATSAKQTVSVDDEPALPPILNDTTENQPTDSHAPVAGNSSSTREPMRLEPAYPNAYVAGRFNAPEQLQVAVFKALEEPQPDHLEYIEEMRCKGEHCEIVIKIAARDGVSAKAAEVIARINAHLKDNPLTVQYMVGVRSITVDDKREGRVELVTMLRTANNNSVRQ